MNLKIYPVVLELVRHLSPYLPALRKRSWALAEQFERALISVPLNIAEGAYSRGKNRQARYQNAAASAREALACLETATALGYLQPLDAELAAPFPCDRDAGAPRRTSALSNTHGSRASAFGRRAYVGKRSQAGASAR